MSPIQGAGQYLDLEGGVRRASESKDEIAVMFRKYFIGWYKTLVKDFAELGHQNYLKKELPK